MEIVPLFVPPLVDHTRYFRHAPARPRVVANMCGFACGYEAICLLRSLRSSEGATQAGCGVRFAVKGCMNVTSTRETILSSIEAPLLLGRVSCVQHRFRLRQ